MANCVTASYSGRPDSLRPPAAWEGSQVGHPLPAVFITVDFGQYVFVKRERGWAFLTFVTLIHLVMNTAAVTGLAVSVAQWVVSGPLRTLYRRGLSASQA